MAMNKNSSNMGEEICHEEPDNIIEEASQHSFIILQNKSTDLVNTMQTELVGLDADEIGESYNNRDEMWTQNLRNIFENGVINFEENLVPATIEDHSDLALGNDFQEIQEPILQINLTQLENVLYERSDGNNENSDIIPDLQVVENPEEIQSHDSLQDVFQDK
ncbi:uncharacterized protein LOC126744191 [Anthonomus grandis grandis]|uniref:uncharacterized protein LOC126744191 n=1 Tax=Anthonomus grandis grandis TaxID=2921223 RepID=UPI0021663E4F|nr:uncharacterized protein LOC126744191 [Anthonomus grandis grandis]